MGKPLAITRHLPPDRAAQRCEIDGGHREVGLAGEMPLHGLGELFSGREVDVSIGNIDRRTLEYAGIQGRHVGRRQYLVS